MGAILMTMAVLLKRKCVLRWTAMDLEAISYSKINHLSIFKKEISENENLRGRDPILSTQTFRAAEIRILSAQTFGKRS